MNLNNTKGMNVIWFRHGLRLHDNPALLKALRDKENGIALFPVFIFDGESAGTKLMGYNRSRFLLDSLQDLDEQFNNHGGKLHIFAGMPVEIFQALNQWIPIKKICMEEDCEPIWKKRDAAIREMCHELNIECVEEVSHTLWNPKDVIYTNGGIPPLTYQMFLHTVQTIGLPPPAAPYPDLSSVKFVELNDDLKNSLDYFLKVPTPEMLNIFPEPENSVAKNKWKGGEREALNLLKERLKIEEAAFLNGYYLPNQSCPNVLEAPKSMSAHLRFGCLSVRRFYWHMHKLFKSVQLKSAGCSPMLGGAHITGQLIWREYFYTMSVNNINYDRMDNNDICLTIPWEKFCPEKFEQWKTGKTGYPLIDAAMRQLLAEGWIHHTLRNATATFLTRGGLWLSWEHGVQHFLKYLIDADWSVCAGNWMWVSSSAFERLLDTSLVTCPIALAKRLDPKGEYIKKYIPELKNVPSNFIHEPWRMPLEKQKEYNCVIGVDYPKRIIDYEIVSKNNNLAMEHLRDTLLQSTPSPKAPPHCRPSNEEEIYHFFWIEN